LGVTVQSNNFSYHQLSVGTDYAFPLGQYALEDAAVGDATSGLVTIVATYPAGYIYSLEGFSSLKQSSTGADCVVTWLPQLVPAGVGFSSFHDQGIAGLRSVVFGRELSRRLPLSVQAPGAIAVRAEIEWDLNTDTVIYRGAIWGYYWDFRAVRTPTGPVRPI